MLFMPGAMQNFGLLRADTGTAVLREIPIPELRPGYVLIKTIAVALNPTDWTSLDAVGDPGTIVGCDYAGIVEHVGSGESNRFKKGDRIAGFAHGANDANAENGAFARYIAVKEDIQMHIPDNVRFEAAATTGVGIGTTGYGLYKVLDLPFPDSTTSDHYSQTEARDTVLIYGGSTATGSIAIQLAKLSGVKVVVTCSPKHFELMKKRGADLVYDYRDPNVGERIRADTGGRITKVFDTVSTEVTAAICAEAMGPAGGIYCNLLGVECPRADVQSTFFLGYSMSGEAYIFEGEHMEAQPEDFIFGSKWYRIAESLWAQGKWTAHPQRIEKGGLLGINDGLQQMRESKVSGEKLVYRVGDTIWPN